MEGSANNDGAGAGQRSRFRLCHWGAVPPARRIPFAPAPRPAREPRWARVVLPLRSGGGAPVHPNARKFRLSTLNLPGPEQINQIKIIMYIVSGRYRRSSSQSRNEIPD
jgi:hypothetical protein